MNKSHHLFSFYFVFASLATSFAWSQEDHFTAASAFIDFDDHLREWDGFGFNYVETFNEYDYEASPQDYGGFSLLSEEDKQEIIRLVFGEEGLKVNLVKMFLGPNHQLTPEGEFDHETSTRNMRQFVKGGIEIAKEQGREIEIITTLYGPPGFVTKQNENRGRDLDPLMKENLYEYMADWVKYLVDQDFPVKYLSPHNEGEGWQRWDQNGTSGKAGHGHDYNLFWPHDQLNEFLIEMPGVLKKYEIEHIGLSCGETYGWDRLHSWGYADAMAKDETVMDHLGLITSHGFLVYGFKRWNTEHRSEGIRILREQNPDLHAWTTSTSWSQMDAHFARELHGNIYHTTCNGIIPWAGIQNPDKWSGDPNPGCAFKVNADGSYEIRPGFYYYKHFSQIGQNGMAVARTWAMDSEITLTAFASNHTQHPNAFVLTHAGDKAKEVVVKLKGGKSSADWVAYRSSDKETSGLPQDERFLKFDRFEVNDQTLTYHVPSRSVTTFVEQ